MPKKRISSPSKNVINEVVPIKLPEQKEQVVPNKKELIDEVTKHARKIYENLGDKKPSLARKGGQRTSFLITPA